MVNSQSRWETIDIGGQPVDVLPPDAQPQAAVIWLQGTDQPPLRSRDAVGRLFAERGLLVVCPHGGEGWWLDLPTPDFRGPLTPARFVTDVLLDWLERQWQLTPPRIGLAGIGRGGQAAVNIGFRHARRFSTVVGIAPDIDFHQWHGRGTMLDHIFTNRESARQQTATLHLHPLNWPRHLLLVCDPGDPIAWEGTERLASKLVSSGVPFECDFERRPGRVDSTHAESTFVRTVEYLHQHLCEPAPVLAGPEPHP